MISPPSPLFRIHRIIKQENNLYLSKLYEKNISYKKKNRERNSPFSFIVLINENSQHKARNILIGIKIAVDFTSISCVNCFEVQLPNLRETLQVIIIILPSKSSDKTSLHLNLSLSKVLHFRLGSMRLNIMSILSQLSKFELPYEKAVNFGVLFISSPASFHWKHFKMQLYLHCIKTS